MKLFKKYVRTAHAWLVFWQEIKDKKIIDKREWFSSEAKANEYIKQKNEDKEGTTFLS